MNSAYLNMYYSFAEALGAKAITKKNTVNYCDSIENTVSTMFHHVIGTKTIGCHFQCLSRCTK